MTDKYQAPFEGGKTPDPARTAKVKNIAKNLARKAMKKAATVKESAVPERPWRKVYEPTSAQELNPGLRAKIDAASNAQKPAPAGRRPIGKIKLMTREEVEQIDEAGVMKKVGRAIAGWGAFDKDKPKDVVKNTKSMSSDALSRIATAKKGSFSLKKSPAALQQKVAKRELEKRSVSEEVELDEAFINGREYASHGLMHPKHASEPIHQPSDRFVDFYASGTGDKMQGKVKLNDGKSVHIQAHPKMGDGKLHKFKVSTDLPKMTNEAKDNREYDYEGDMAMSQLKSVITNAQKLHDMLDPDTNLPEWVQSKITLAEDYIVTAANYMNGEMNEEFEQVEENARGYEKLASAIRSRAAKKKLAVEAHDAVGEEDADINNDGKTDKTDVYLHTKRRAIGKAISTRLATKAGK